MRGLLGYCLLGVLGTANAAPLELVHQGRLLDPAGSAIEGESVSLTFTLHTAPPLPADLWTDEIAVVVENGYYSAVLGTDSNNPLDASWFSEETWFEISLTTSGSVMSDQVIRPSPSALHATSVYVPDDATCGVGNRGAIRFVGGSAGVPDVVEICLSDGNDTTEWSPMSGITPAGQFTGGTLLSAEESAQINAWVGNPLAEWALCYRRSINGASSTTFHSMCDNRANTVTVMTLSTGKKIGGYTPIPWNQGCYATEPTQSSFLFSLTNDYQHTLTSTNHHTCGSSGHGTTFGGGHDLYIQSGMDVGYCNLGHTYACRPGFSGNACRTDFCGGTGGVPVIEYEVYFQVN